MPQDPFQEPVHRILTCQFELHLAAAPQEFLHLLDAQPLGFVHLKCHSPATLAPLLVSGSFRIGITPRLQAHSALEKSESSLVGSKSIMMISMQCRLSG